MFEPYREEVRRIKEDTSLDYDEKKDLLFVYNTSYVFGTLLNIIFVKPFQLIGWVVRNFDAIAGTSLVLYGLFVLLVIIYVAT
jgi:hypothetical protein